jgi:hypothetical protein
MTNLFQLKMCMNVPVRGKGHLQTCIAGRKDNLGCSILRKDDPKTPIKYRFINKYQGL